MDNRDSYDIPALRQRMLAALGEKAEAYPHQIEQRYPHILEKLVQFWGRAEADAYLNGLMVADRADRKGFPDEVASELFKLSMIHGAQQQGSASGSVGATAGWSSSELSSEVDDFLSRRSNR